MQKQNILHVSIREINALYRDYMPFVKNGGLFVASQKQHQLGDKVFMIITLLDDDEQLPITGRVIWITPKGAQNSRVAGIGIQFSDDNIAKKARARIENALAGLMKSDRLTNTM